MKEVAFIVCTALARQKITAVLTGGSAATVYAPKAYQSRDMDFILHWHGEATGGAAELAALGYTERGQTWYHKDSSFTLEFPKGPLAVGDDLIKVWDTLHSGDLLLHILTPTDCVRDRLMWFYLQPTDRSALAAALGVAAEQKVDLKPIEAWSAREGFTDKFEEFRRRLTRLG